MYSERQVQNSTRNKEWKGNGEGTVRVNLSEGGENSKSVDKLYQFVKYLKDLGVKD